MKKLVNIAHARTQFQKETMARIERDRVCPFCEKNLLTYHTKPILKKGKHWTLTTNFQPYKGTKLHLLAVSRKHTTRFEDLSPAAHHELFALFAKELQKKKIRGGALFMRFGNTDYTGGSVEHLHAQLVSGTKRGDDREPIITYLGYGAKKTTAPK